MRASRSFSNCSHISGQCNADTYADVGVCQKVAISMGMTRSLVIGFLLQKHVSWTRALGTMVATAFSAVLLHTVRTELW